MEKQPKKYVRMNPFYSLTIWLVSKIYYIKQTILNKYINFFNRQFYLSAIKSIK